jgi:N-acetylglucosamine kinase-like BadF-type ATPase
MIIVDLGQSGSRTSIDGEIIQLSRGKFADESVLDAITAIAAMLPSATSDVVALSVTGHFGIVDSAEPYHRLAHHIWGASSTVVIDDGLAGYFGAVGGSDGVALTLGGGVVAVAGCEGKLAHADGLGSVFGDEGSGYWLGSRAITRALATRDMRDKDHDLADFLADEVVAFDELAVKNSAQAASLAINTGKKLLEAAEAGIESAIAIRDEGAMRLGRTVVGAWEKSGGDLSAEPVIAISGGLSKNVPYVDQILENILIEIPGAKAITPLGNNIDGARWIAENISDDLPPLMRWARGR